MQTDLSRALLAPDCAPEPPPPAPVNRVPVAARGKVATSISEDRGSIASQQKRCRSRALVDFGRPPSFYSSILEMVLEMVGRWYVRAEDARGSEHVCVLLCGLLGVRVCVCVCARVFAERK